MKTFREREVDIYNEEEEEIGSRLRRAKRAFPYNDDATQPDSKRASTDSTIPFLPNFLMKSLTKEDKVNILKWRKLVNQGKKMQASNMVSGESNQDKPPKKDDEKKVKPLRRQTTVVEKGIKKGSLKVKLKDEVDKGYFNSLFNLSRECLYHGYDSNFSSKPLALSMDSFDTNKIRMVKTIGMSAGRCNPEPYAVIDPGATEDLVGGLGWRISFVSNQVEILCGALTGMGTKALPIVDAITAIETAGGGSNLDWYGRCNL